MSKPVSMRDVIKCLKHLGHEGISEIHLLPKSQDELVKPVLQALGMDTRLGFRIQAYKHRDLDNNVAIGYRYEGTIRTDREWANSKGCSTIERISITAFDDLSLTHELQDLMGGQLDLTSAEGSYDLLNEDASFRDLIVETYKEDSELIKQLNNICKQVRGEE